MSPHPAAANSRPSTSASAIRPLQQLQPQLPQAPAQPHEPAQSPAQSQAQAQPSKPYSAKTPTQPLQSSSQSSGKSPRPATTLAQIATDWGSDLQDPKGDFDQAYNWFANAYAKPESGQSPQTREPSEPLLNKQEQNAFSNFLENVLTDPGNAVSLNNGMHWLDSDLLSGDYAGQYTPLFTSFRGNDTLQELQRRQIESLSGPAAEIARRSKLLAQESSEQPARRSQLQPRQSQSHTQIEQYSQQYQQLQPHDAQQEPGIGQSKVHVQGAYLDNLELHTSQTQPLMASQPVDFGPLRLAGPTDPTGHVVGHGIDSDAPLAPPISSTQGPHGTSQTAAMWATSRAPSQGQPSANHMQGQFTYYATNSPMGLSVQGPPTMQQMVTMPDVTFQSQGTQLPSSMVTMAGLQHQGQTETQAQAQNLSQNQGQNPKQNQNQNHAHSASPDPRSGKLEFYKGFVEMQKQMNGPVDTNTLSAMVNAEHLFLVAQKGIVKTISQSHTPGDSTSKMSGAFEDPASRPQASATARKRRDFLSEDQVRLNHIHSEKRRRDLIKQLFAEMASLVPTIGSASETQPKSVTLNMVYAFLVKLADENKRVRAALETGGVSTAEIHAFKLSPPMPDLAESVPPESPGQESQQRDEPRRPQQQSMQA